MCFQTSSSAVFSVYQLLSFQFDELEVSLLLRIALLASFEPFNSKNPYCGQRLTGKVYPWRCRGDGLFI